MPCTSTRRGSSWYFAYCIVPSIAHLISLSFGSTSILPPRLPYGSWRPAQRLPTSNDLIPPSAPSPLQVFGIKPFCEPDVIDVHPPSLFRLAFVSLTPYRLTIIGRQRVDLSLNKPTEPPLVLFL